MNQQNQQQKEIRQVILNNVETRQEGENDLVISGYVATFNSKSKFLGFYEVIDPKAFDNTLKDGHNIFALYNHDWDKPLGDIETNTLKLEIDNVGLRFELKIDTSISYCKDVYSLVKNNLIKGCSFGFYVNEDTWTTNNDYEDIRTLLDVTLLEITLTVAPAYNETSCSCRSYDVHKKELENEILKRKLKLELELMQ